MKRTFMNADGGEDGVEISAGRIKTQIFTDSLRSHGWPQMREKFFNANGREWPRIFTNPDGLR
jgi:hypothetical protein